MRLTGVSHIHATGERKPACIVIVIVVVILSDEQEACPIIDFGSYLLSGLEEHRNILHCV